MDLNKRTKSTVGALTLISLCAGGLGTLEDAELRAKNYTTDHSTPALTTVTFLPAISAGGTATLIANDVDQQVGEAHLAGRVSPFKYYR